MAEDENRVFNGISTKAVTISKTERNSVFNGEVTSQNIQALRIIGKLIDIMEIHMADEISGIEASSEGQGPIAILVLSVADIEVNVLDAFMADDVETSHEADSIRCMTYAYANGHFISAN